MTGFVTQEERRSFSLADVSAFFTSGARMMGTPNSLSSEEADPSKSLSSGWSTSYSGILLLSDFGLSRDVLGSLLDFV